MEGINIGALVAAFIAAMGVPSAIMGLLVWRLQRRLTKRDKLQQENEAAREELEVSLVQCCWASIALGEATAKAVQRIPDAHCNGDMHAALDYAATVKRDQKIFLAKKGIHSLVD